jgi:uncharacterized membrane protein YgcG
MKRFAIAGLVLGWALLLATGQAVAAPRAGSPFPKPVSGQGVYDNAGIFGPDTIAWAEKTIDAVGTRTGTQIVVYTQIPTDEWAHADPDAAALLEQWSVGGPSANGLVVFFDMQSDRLTYDVAIRGRDGLPASLDTGTLDRILYVAMEPLLAQGDFDGALQIGLSRIQAANAPAPGPPYPAPIDGQRVYDYAGIFSPKAIAEAEAIIAGIDQRTGAQVAVYTQVKPQSDDLDKADADARALMDQWGVGRKGFDDGLVIMFDMQDNLRHGQVSLYAGAGYRAAFLSDSDRQDIFDNQMKPLLVMGDLDGGLLTALRAVDANATPEHAAALERGRQINALLVVGSLLLGLLLILTAAIRWLRHGRDPIYLDDRSILMPAPPDGLTPAMATLLLEDKTSKRTISTALMDLAARGAIAFRQEHANDPTDAGIEYKGEGDGTIRGPEGDLADAIGAQAAGHGNYVTPKRLYHLLEAFADLKRSLENAAVDRGWLNEAPNEVTFRWGLVGGLEIAAACVVIFFWLFVAASALFVLAVSLAVAGVVTLCITPFMPARTRHGSILYAQLSAYKRTLGLTMIASGSMQEVVLRHAVPWITTPDQAMVWGVAFGLNRELDLVLSRTLASGPAGEDYVSGPPAWTPSWWVYSSGHSHSGGSGISSGHAGLYSSTPFPDPGSIMAALGSISSPSSPASSSSSSGSSSFGSGSFGGGGGGGGGGAGGGF